MLNRNPNDHSGNPAVGAPSRRRALAIAAVALLILAAGCAGPSRFINKPEPEKKGARAVQQLPLSAFRQVGMASFYDEKLTDYQTASGEMYHMNDFTAAHPVLPFNTLVKVTNLSNNLSVMVRINDRGPYTKRRIIDLSWAAAQKIGLIEAGTAKVEILVVK